MPHAPDLFSSVAWPPAASLCIANPAGSGDPEYGRSGPQLETFPPPMVEAVAPKCRGQAMAAQQAACQEGRDWYAVSGRVEMPRGVEFAAPGYTLSLNTGNPPALFVDGPLTGSGGDSLSQQWPGCSVTPMPSFSGGIHFTGGERDHGGC